ncbi:NAD-dependent epimerase/dehydratase family protein [Nocardia farcinica]|uniref:NAD-dependent epimerase/dehydratase family protein n=1 Tax=Nocardia farcinica TaxID=37329 RepID=UPI0024537C79|nr:NAD-dependent epimerase/dehydratase family protein [Nocardia farcinica]
MDVLVAGATGFIGQRLCPKLVTAGHRVRAMTRAPMSYRGVGTPVGADVADPASLRAALGGGARGDDLVH